MIQFESRSQVNKGNIVRFHDQLTLRSFKEDFFNIRTRGYIPSNGVQLVCIELEKMRMEVVTLYLPERTIENKSG
jgi:hypothetical protein